MCDYAQNNNIIKQQHYKQPVMLKLNTYIICWKLAYVSKESRKMSIASNIAL